MNFKKGDNVKFIKLEGRLPIGYDHNQNNINLVSHGKLTVSSKYNDEFAIIKGTCRGNDYLMVEYMDDNNHIVCLAYNKSNLELVNKAIDIKIDDKMEIIINEDIITVIDDEGDCIEMTKEQLEKIYSKAKGL